MGARLATNHLQDGEFAGDRAFERLANEDDVDLTNDLDVRKQKVDELCNTLATRDSMRSTLGIPRVPLRNVLKSEFEVTPVGYGASAQSPSTNKSDSEKNRENSVLGTIA